MSDLIDRQDAIDAILDINAEHRVSWKDAVIDIIDELPSQCNVIYCRDCENWIRGYITDTDDFISPKCGKYQQMVGHSSDDYCSLAERRIDD